MIRSAAASQSPRGTYRSALPSSGHCAIAAAACSGVETIQRDVRVRAAGQLRRERGEPVLPAGNEDEAGIRCPCHARRGSLADPAGRARDADDHRRDPAG